MWTKLADEFLEDETVVALKDRAYRLHVSAMVYSGRNLTDGVITGKQLKVIQAILGFTVKRFVVELVEAGLWIPVSAGHEIKNFLRFNPSAAEVKAERERNAQRQRDYRERHSERNEERNALRNGGSNAAPTRPVVKDLTKAVVHKRPEATAQEKSHVQALIDASLKGAA